MTAPLLRHAAVLASTLVLAPATLAHAGTVPGSAVADAHKRATPRREAASARSDLSFSLPSMAAGLLFPGSAGPRRTCGNGRAPVYGLTLRGLPLLPGFGLWLRIC